MGKYWHDIADAVLDAEVRVGELLKVVPINQGKRTDLQLRRTGAPKSETPKQQVRENIGITRQQADRFVKLAEIKSHNKRVSVMDTPQIVNGLQVASYLLVFVLYAH